MGLLQNLKEMFAGMAQSDPFAKAFRDHFTGVASINSLYKVVDQVPVSEQAGRGQPILAGYKMASVFVAETSGNRSLTGMVAQRRDTGEFDVLSIKNVASPEQPIEPMDRIAARHRAVAAKTCVFGLARG